MESGVANESLSKDISLRQLHDFFAVYRHDEKKLMKEVSTHEVVNNVIIQAATNGLGIASWTDYMDGGLKSLETFMSHW